MDRFILKPYKNGSPNYVLWDIERKISVGPEIVGLKKAIAICKWYNDLNINK